MKVRLNKFLSQSGVCSRRSADELISKGKVFVNGKVAGLGDKIDPDKDKVAINNKTIKQSNNLIYYALYKPKDVISTASDEIGRQTVTDLVPKNPPVHPVGRLDANSQGLIILTNDGELTQKLTHPSFEHEKEYEVKFKHQTSNPPAGRAGLKIIDRKNNIAKKFIQGMTIEGKCMKMDKATITPLDTKFYMLNAVLHTGYNRQIRKMCAKMNLEIVRLVRTRIGKLTLASLNIKPGEYKLISREDIL